MSLYDYLAGVADTYPDSMLYRDAVFLTAHNAFANTEDGWKVSQQSFNITNLFDYGARSFAIDLHYHQGEISLCHEIKGQTDPTKSCSLSKALRGFKDPVMLEDWLTDCKLILEKAPKDIVTLHLESYVPAHEVKILFDKVDITKYLLKQDPNQAITLGEMRKQDTRLVVFSDYAYNRYSSIVNGIFPTKLYKETKFDINNIKETDACEFRRDYRAHYENKNIYLSVFNHFPSFSTTKNYDDDVNNYGFIISHLERCILKLNRVPNFLMLDFIEVGRGFSNKGALDLIIKLNHLNISNVNLINQLPLQGSVMSAIDSQTPLQGNEVRDVLIGAVQSIISILKKSEICEMFVLSAVDYSMYSYHQKLSNFFSPGSKMHYACIQHSRSFLPIFPHLATESLVAYKAYHISSTFFEVSLVGLMCASPVFAKFNNYKITHYRCHFIIPSYVAYLVSRYYF